MKTKDNTELSHNNLNQDRALFHKISEGQYTALEVLFDKYYHPLCRFGLSYEKNLAIVEEKISDVFIVLWKKRKELKNIDRPKSYIYVMAKNSLRKKMSHSTNPLTIDTINSFLFLPAQRRT